MVALVESLQKAGATRATARRLAKETDPKASKGRPRNYVFRFQPKEKSFSLSLQFRKAQVPRTEIIRVLQSILEQLSQESD